MAGLHGISAPLAIVGLLALSLGSAALAFLSRESRVLEWVRRVALAVLVAEAALGLALAVRGASPAEWIHWLYGGVIGLVLLVPSALGDVSPRARSGSVALCSGIAATLAWRLWSSG